MPAQPSRPLLVAELLAIGSELTVGDTRDTNSGEIAAALTAEGVRVGRIVALPDDLDAVVAAFREALGRADVVVTTGGLGPTPDDLTREAVARVWNETPVVDPGLEAWLRGLWARRGLDFPEINLKQAWLLPSATAIPNANGTAPGWWVDRADGRVVICLPGPPREMRPMWTEWALPRLRHRGIGRPTATRTLRLSGIGESQVAAILGEDLLRATNPSVATYARADAVDVRISAVDPSGEGGSGAASVVEATERRVRELLGGHVWATGATSWADAVGERLAGAGWRLAAVEIGTGGSVTALLGDARWLEAIEARRAPPRVGEDLELIAAEAALRAGVEVGLAVRATERAGDTAVSVAVTTPRGTHRERRLAFLGGAQGRTRAALTAAGILFSALAGDDDPSTRPSGGTS